VDTSEIKLVQSLKDKNSQQEAFRELVSLYKERLYWHIRKIVVSHQDADDVLQNTFIKVFKNISKFKGDSKLYTWLYRIATNEAITFLNKKAKQKNIPWEDAKQQAVATLENDVYFEGDAIQLALQKAIATLPKKQQLVFNMKYFDQIKYEELATILDTSVGGLKSNYHLAVKKITDYLKNNQVDFTI
jgi:RNA polymerase sigma-70 factor (ECF subfamily)